MSQYSKLLGSIVGGLIGLGVSKFGLPAEWASPEMVSAVTLIFSAIATYAFPKNAG